jgi:hypothetical protein
MCLEYIYLGDGWGAEDQIDSQHDHATVVGQHENSPLPIEQGQLAHHLGRQAHTAHKSAHTIQFLHIPRSFSLVPRLSPAQGCLSGIISLQPHSLSKCKQSCLAGFVNSGMNYEFPLSKHRQADSSTREAISLHVLSIVQYMCLL